MSVTQKNKCRLSLLGAVTAGLLMSVTTTQAAPYALDIHGKPLASRSDTGLRMPAITLKRFEHLNGAADPAPP